MYKQNLTLNNLELICHKPNQPSVDFITPLLKFESTE